jgi:hypothetical protein
MPNEKTLSRNLTEWKRLKNSRNSEKTVSDTLHVNKTLLSIAPPIGIGLSAQLFLDVFTSKEEILRPTLVLPHFGHFSFLALRSYSLMV